MTENYQLVIEKEKGRLDKVIAEKIKDLSRTKIKELVNDKNILVNNKAEKVSYKVQAGDLIDITVPPAKPLSLEAQNLNLDIVYEDADVIVVNKPQGMVVHPSAGHPDHTLVNGLLYHTHELADSPEGFRPGIVHRIDKDTSGLLMAVNPKGKAAVTHFTVLEQFKDYSLVKCVLETGRTHQIRVHMKYIGHPLAGDPLYGPKKTLTGHGQFLHAETLGFYQPSTHKWLEFSAPLPAIFEKQLENLRRETKH